MAVATFMYAACPSDSVARSVTESACGTKFALINSEIDVLLAETRQHSATTGQDTHSEESDLAALQERVRKWQALAETNAISEESVKTAIQTLTKSVSKITARLDSFQSCSLDTLNLLATAHRCAEIRIKRWKKLTLKTEQERGSLIVEAGAIAIQAYPLVPATFLVNGEEFLAGQQFLLSETPGCVLDTAVFDVPPNCEFVVLYEYVDSDIQLPADLAEELK